MRVIVGCEFSQIVCQSFRNLGHDAFSCDLLPTEGNPEWHFQCDVLEILEQNWDLGIFHPSCTYITNAGSRHLHSHVASKNGVRAKIHGAERMRYMEEACRFFNALKNAPIPHICIENPIPHKYARALIGDYTQIIQPWQFGHTESKATCLWLKNLPKLEPTNNVKEEMLKLPKKEAHKVHYASPGKDRWKIRSRTYQGIAEAMAEQWTRYYLENK